MKRDEKFWEPAIVENKHSERSFIVRSGNDKIYRRNRRHILKTGENKFLKESENDELDYPSSELATNEQTTSASQSEQQDKQTSVPTTPTIETRTRSGRISRKPAFLQENYV